MAENVFDQIIEDTDDPIQKARVAVMRDSGPAALPLADMLLSMGRGGFRGLLVSQMTVEQLAVSMWEGLTRAEFPLR